MDNILTYVRSNMSTFEESPFNEVDSAVLAWFSYLHLPAFLFYDAQGQERSVKMYELMRAECFEDMKYGVKSPDLSIDLLMAMCASPRFRDMLLMFYEDRLEYATSTQFAAVTFEIMPGVFYLSYRGTDDTFIGWKEDCDLALQEPIMSQSLAGEYIDRVAAKVSGRLMTGGHSKGGNLAVYGAAAASEATRDRIVKVYSFDGPGFQEEDFQEAAFDEIRDRIVKIIPESSMIGMIFMQECEYRIVKSSAKGINQHNLFSWAVTDGEFHYVDALGRESKLVYRSLNRWIAGLEPEERRQFIDDIFAILEETGVSSFDELGAGIKDNIPIMAKKYLSMDKEKRDFLKGTLKELADISAKTVPELIREKQHQAEDDDADESEGATIKRQEHRNVFDLISRR